MSAAEGSATQVAREVVEALVAGGVRHAVLSPGSRSAPLAYALLSAAEAGWLELHVRLDERSAGFLAVGLSRAAARNGAPAAAVAVGTTSGTAVANLHPAFLEAAHAGLPLVVLSADRPHELRGTGANQTTEQVGIFGAAPRAAAEIPAGAPPGPALRQVVSRALAAATGARTGDPGPVHLNVAFREPLVPAARWEPGDRPPLRALVPPSPAPDPVRLPPGPRTVVVAGDGAGPAARTLAEAGGWPLLAEPTSGARSGPNALGPYRLLLAEPRLGGAVERAVVLGRPTLSRPVSALLARPGVEVVVVAPTGARWTDVAGTASSVVLAAAPHPDDEAAAADPRSEHARWLAAWRRSGEVAASVLDRRGSDTGTPADASRPLDGLDVARAVAAATSRRSGGAGTLVVGSSMAVRDLDLVGAPWPAGDEARAVANRGLAGIDGTVATATGIALATGEPVRAVLGDLTFLHDAGSLLRGELEPDPDLQVVVVNDGGGAIFATLEPGAPGEPARSAAFERVFGTPQHADLAGIAAGYGAGHTLVRTTAELATALERPVRGRSVVEVVLDRTTLRDDRERVAAAVRTAVAAALDAVQEPPR